MKSNKHRRKELKEARLAKQAKREVARLASRIPFRPEHRVAVCPEALSEESQRSWGVPRYYGDEYYKCVDCGEDCLFSAEQQKEWFEVKKRYLYQRPIRCKQCFMQWCSDRKTKFRMDKALEELRLAPDSEEAMRDCALSIVEFHKNTGKGNLNTAIRILRQLKEDGDAMSYCTEQIQKEVQAKKEMVKAIKVLREETICAFRDSTGKPEELRAALMQCLVQGYEAGIDVSELWSILAEGDDCIVTQAELPEADKAVVLGHVLFLINAIADDYSPDAIERHKRRVRKWYDDWSNNL